VKTPQISTTKVKNYGHYGLMENALLKKQLSKKKLLLDQTHRLCWEALRAYLIREIRIPLENVIIITENR
jgi:hypothetical protein